MIDGFKIDVKSDEMKAILQKRVESHRAKVGEYEKMMADAGSQLKQASDLVEQLRQVQVPQSHSYIGGFPRQLEPTHGVACDPLLHMKAKIAQHKTKADAAQFVIDHIIPGEVYRVDAGIVLMGYGGFQEEHEILGGGGMLVADPLLQFGA